MENKKILLLVEDEKEIRDVYQTTLLDAGYIVDYATNGKDALDKIESSKYDLILLDIMMPQMDGHEVLTRLSKDHKMPVDTPIVLLTNLVNDNTIKDMMKLGASSYIVKVDITPDQLLEKVKQHLVG
jgi:CheY-like chemotaxis protein